MNPVLTANLLWIAGVVVNLVIIIAALLILPKRRKPTAAMAWLLAIFLLPYLGILLFLLIGSIKLPKSRVDEQARIDAQIRERVALAKLDPPHDGEPRWFQRVLQQAETLTGIPALHGNAMTLNGDYNGSILQMAAEVDRAKRYVHVEFFIIGLDDTTRPFFAALENAVKRGVKVRVLADYIATRKVGTSKEVIAFLDRIGAEWAWMLPVQPFKGKYQRPDLRNHRKIVVVDGTVAYTGSQNMIDRSYDSPKNIKRGLQWQELVTRVEGPAASALNVVFLSDWAIETGEALTDEHVAVDSMPAKGDLLCQVVPSGPTYSTENNLRLFLSLIYGATEKVILTSPYFVPDEAMVYAITSACERGVEVQLFVSEIGDQWLVWHAQRSYYEVLLQAGVRIFLYPAPYILHSKHFSIDDDIAVIGSSNMDIRSFSLNAEVSVLVRGASFVAGMREVEEGYRRAGRELTLDEWRREPRSATFSDGVARLTSALN
ncbi:cardiolipin synthase [Microbacterium sp. BK668]|uniref:cardiolipin synthase n=1 Tax=Microbacterium sp. BK668 TaxID=2512118 RepID=UPI00105EFE45|nr:cardiolipin synthase [Microbacterium sp. BK668]TDN91174.1 cardiolipin synthetase 2 [Microbacterium sp. BK668]